MLEAVYYLYVERSLQGWLRLPSVKAPRSRVGVKRLRYIVLLTAVGVKEMAMVQRLGVDDMCALARLTRNSRIELVSKLLFNA